MQTAGCRSLAETIRKVQENSEGLELNGKHQFPIYDDVNLLGKTLNIRKKHTESQLDTSKEIDLEVNTEEN
jgi:hypothetical protein